MKHGTFKRKDGPSNDSDPTDPFLEIEVDKSIELPPPPKAEEDPMPRRLYITRALLDKYGMTEGCVGCTMSAMANTGMVHSEACRIRIEKEMKQIPESRMRLKEIKVKQHHFIKKHMKKHNRDIADKADSDDAMDPNDSGTSSSHQRKRKAESDANVDYLDMMCCLCEEAIEINEVAIEDEEPFNSKEMEEKTWSWADITEEEDEKEQNDVKQDYYDEMTGRILKYEKVVAARLEEVEALIKMGVWEIVPLRECVSRTQRRPIKGRWIDINKGDDDLEVDPEPTWRSR